MFASFASPIVKVSPFLLYQTKSLSDDLSCLTFSKSFNVDISVPHLIPLKPSGSERGLEERAEAKQPIKKMVDKIAKILTFFMASAFSFTILLRCYPPFTLSLFISRSATFASGVGDFRTECAIDILTIIKHALHERPSRWRRPSRCRLL